MPLDLTALKEQVTRNKTVAGSTKLLLERLFAEVEAHKDDPVALQAIVDEMRADIDAEAAAVAANTPGDTGGTGGEGGETPDPEARRR